MRYVMDGLRFIMLNETPCAEPHAGCCGDWGLETPGYPIRHAAQFHQLDSPEEYEAENANYESCLKKDFGDD